MTPVRRVWGEGRAGARGGVALAFGLQVCAAVGCGGVPGTTAPAPGDATEGPAAPPRSQPGAPSGAADPNAPRPWLVVLDPGHGGADLGTRGPSGAVEKDLTLAIATEAAAALERHADVDVLLTRDADLEVSLADRSGLANRSRADAFVSIHANSHTDPGRSGVETYVLDVASDDAAVRVQARENAHAAAPGPVVADDATRVAAELQASGRTLESRRMAAAVHGRVVQDLRAFYGVETIRDLGVKSALLYVLLNTDMPAALLETAFMSHRAEEQRLRTRAYQQKVAAGIADGLYGWLTAEAVRTPR